MREKITGFIRSIQFRYIATALAVVLLVIIAVFLKNRADHFVYTSYEVKVSEEKTDSVSRFEYCDGYALRYSADGAVLMKKDLEQIWSVTYAMTDPRVDECGGKILIYDRGGTAVFVCNNKEKLSSFQMEKAILAARISSKGTIAAVLKDGEKTEFLYCSEDGTRIAQGESTMSDPGYPFALAVSDDGMQVAVSYLTANGGMTGTSVRFYDFSSTGKEYENNMAGELVLSGSFAPEIQYVGSRCVVFRDDGFTSVGSALSREDDVEVDFTEDIVSVFHDDSHIGFVFRSDEKSHLFEMRIYNTAGKVVASTYIDHAYSHLHVCDDQVIISGGTSLSIFTMRGVCRFSGNLKEGAAADVLKAGRNRYMVLTDQMIEVIALK